MSDNHLITRILAMIVLCIITVLVIFNLFFSLREFQRELIYLNCEIKRSHGAERRHYIKRRRRLWLSLIPFVKY